ncbi:hypothetical protein [Chryseobacterium indoltheticum]|uniref:hypothetical protein n=1 Tax=Chryseobacterium indoltheticum TaxID=254 RepID=UPI003F498FBD
MSVFLIRKNGWELILKILSIPNKNYFDKKSFLLYVTFFKVLIIGIVLIKIGMPYLNDEKENNQMQFAGVYEVKSSESPYQYLFFHKDQYLIFMKRSSEKMTAFHYYVSFDNQIILEDEQNRVSKHFL